uniref:Uncharacterized protein n=1 Tax=Pseudomonas phage RVTF4 TaxID=3236931 RepID=A0AB39CD02_9VIRU
MFTSGIPRITKDYVAGLIVDEHVRYIPETRTTICSVRLVNSQTITESATCGADQEYDPIKGRTVARRKVLNEIIRYEHYLQRQRIYEAERELKHGPRN